MRKSAVDHPEALYWRDHPTRPCCPFGHVSCIGRGQERLRFQISQVIGDKKEGHFKHLSRQLCVYIDHLCIYTYVIHSIIYHIAYCCTPGANEKHSEKFAAGSAKLAASTQ